MPLRIDNQIQVIDKAICRHIDHFEVSGRGAISQDILKNLRDFVEHIMLKIYAQGGDIENSYSNICDAISYVKSRGNLRSLRHFHEFLQIVASHYTIDEDNSERLMLKYYEYLLKIKKLLKDLFSLDVLCNLDKFPLNTDTNLQEYYKKIVSVVNHHPRQNVDKSDKYYIQKIKPFFVNHQICYEVTFTPAIDYASKFNRVIAFTSFEMPDNYAVKLLLVSDSIEMLEKTMPISVIVGWEIAIRDCEYKNFTYLVRGRRITTGYSEQRGISKFLTSTGFNLIDLVDFSETDFQRIKQIATRRAKTVVFFDVLERCRELIKNSEEGSNLLRYLLYNMSNKIIKNQHYSYANSNMSELYVKNGCIPFDRIPFNFSPIGHNPRLGDLFNCIDPIDREHEILARLIRNNTETKGLLFTSVSDINGFADLNTLIRKYNDVLWSGHRNSSKLVIENGHIFINGYKKDAHYIISELEDLAQKGIRNYSRSVQKWFDESSHVVDCDEKRKILKQMFTNSKVALIYGSAGTGKSTLINHLAHFFVGKSKLYLAQTNPAVDNLKRRVTASHSIFSTITKFLINPDVNTEYDLLIIDECSTVNNRDMKKILNKATYQLLVLVGDSYQIASIRFGNWFSVAREFIPETSVSELTRPYRSNDQNLLTLWERVRNMDENILELLAKQGYSNSLDATIFTQAEDDEIILCLNYDGLYGINNINRFLQECNSNSPVAWGVQQFKINDPILFNESNRFSPLIYNNMKGRISGVKILDIGEPTERIQFDVELDIIINGVDAYDQDFELLDDAGNDNSIIRFTVSKLKSEDDDDDNSLETVVPFQVSYAISIHKAQGLEYSSVKLVITDEIDELITHNIFYTAITRAREKLKIYWTPEVEHKILNSIKPKNHGKDVALLKIGM